MFRLPRWVPVAALALLIAGVFVGDSVKPIYAASQTLSLPDIRQEYSMWCWAATVQSIGRYLTGNNAINQCTIVSTQYSVCPNWGSIDTNNIKNALWSAYNINSNSVTWSSVSFATIKSEISALRPLSVYWAQGSGNGHHITIRGYNDNGQRVYYLDPDSANGGPKDQPYSWVVSSSNPIHTWQQTLTGIHH